MKRYDYVIDRDALKFVESLSKTDRQRIDRKLESLCDNPLPVGAMKLSGQDDLFRVRVGDYRIIYAIENEKILIIVVRIGHRKNVYRSY